MGILLIVRNLLSDFASRSSTAAIILLLAVNSLHAQNTEAFDSLEIGLQYVANTNRNVFHDYWAPGQGVAGFIETPFYYGTVQAGVHASPFYGRETHLSDFHAVFIYLKWGLRWPLLNELDWYNYIGVGSNVMIFEKEEAYERYESELGMCFNSGVSYRVHRNMAVNFSGSYNLIFTHKPIKLLFLSAGISYSLSTPGWLRVFLE